MKLLSCLTVGKRRWLINQTNIKLNISRSDRVDEANTSRDDQVVNNTFSPRSHANTYELFFVIAVRHEYGRLYRSER